MSTLPDTYYLAAGIDPEAIPPNRIDPEAIPPNRILDTTEATWHEVKGAERAGVVQDEGHQEGCETEQPATREAAALQHGDVIAVRDGVFYEVTHVEPVTYTGAPGDEVMIVLKGGQILRSRGSLIYDLADPETAESWRREAVRKAAAARLADKLRRMANGLENGSLPPPLYVATLHYTMAHPDDIYAAADALGTTVEQGDHSIRATHRAEGRGDLEVHLTALRLAEEAKS